MTSHPAQPRLAWLPMRTKLGVANRSAQHLRLSAIGMITLVFAALRGTVDEIWIGDSHAVLLNDSRFPCPPLRRTSGARFAWHLGPRLMYSVARDGFPRSVSVVARLIGLFAPRRRIVWVFCLGEIDIRCHLAPRWRDGRGNLEFVRTYGELAGAVADKARARAAVLVVPPPPSDGCLNDPQFPVAGTIGERLTIHGQVRDAIIDFAKEPIAGDRPLAVLDVTHGLASADGQLADEHTFDGCHTNDSGRRVVLEGVRDLLLSIPSGPAPR